MPHKIHRWIKISDSHKLPPKPGVYAIYVNKKLVYIGQSTNIRTRVWKHRHSHPLESLMFKCKVVERPGEWLAIEYRLIGRLRPSWNRLVLNRARPKRKLYGKAKQQATERKAKCEAAAARNISINLLTPDAVVYYTEPMRPPQSKITVEVPENNIKQWLRPLLDRRGMSVEDLAKNIGVWRATIYFWFEDKTRPDAQTMARVCRVLNVPLEQGLSQYTPKPLGRPKGQAAGVSGSGVQAIRGRRRR